jgi:hypothetical protein
MVVDFRYRVKYADRGQTWMNGIHPIHTKHDVEWQAGTSVEQHRQLQPTARVGIMTGPCEPNSPTPLRIATVRGMLSVLRDLLETVDAVAERTAISATVPENDP